MNMFILNFTVQLKAGGYLNLSSCFTVHLAASVSITARVQVPGIANCKVHVQKCAAANLATENIFIQKTKNTFIATRIQENCECNFRSNLECLSWSAAVVSVCSGC